MINRPKNTETFIHYNAAKLEIEGAPGPKITCDLFRTPGIPSYFFQLRLRAYPYLCVTHEWHRHVQKNAPRH